MNEATVRAYVSIRNGNLIYTSPVTSFQATVTGKNGPTPGCILVTPEGTDVDFSQLTAFGGLCWLHNIDDTNWVEYGIWDSATLTFYPLGELLPGECYPLRLSRNLQKDEPGTGTGPGTGTTKLRFKSYNQPLRVDVDAFDP